MFKKAKHELQALKEAIQIHKKYIKDRLALMAETNKQLEQAVNDTRAISVALIHKLRSELKVAKKSITSICQKLKEGTVLLDYSGRIVQINSAAEAIFGVDQLSVINLEFTEAITTFLEVGDITNMSYFKKGFFNDLSTKIIKSEKFNDKIFATQDHLNKTLPWFFNPDNEIRVDVKVKHTQEIIPLNLSFSILNNDPMELGDVIYIFMFAKTKT